MKRVYRIALALLPALLMIPGLGFKKPHQSPVIYHGKFHTVPVHEIAPDGWLRELLLRQRNGLGLHHEESGYPYNTCLWAGEIPKGGNPNGQRWWPYEQSGYLVDGLYRCGLALKNTALMNIGRSNIDYVLTHPQDNGKLGLSVIGNTQWPFSVFVRAMMADYEATHNPEILSALTKHFLALPKENLDDRETCIIESICWTYSHTGDERLIQLAEHIWQSFVTNNKKNSTVFRSEKMIAADSVYGHGVTISEIGKQPAILYLYTGKEEYKKAAVGFFTAVERDHGMVDGIPSSSESLAGKKPEGVHETCDVSDYTWSLGYLMMATGDTKWADKIERGIFNAGLASVSKDFKSHQYFSSPNQIYATQNSYQASKRKQWQSRQAYRPGFDTECCSGNVHRMFPNYVNRLWMKDADEGIVAAMYAPNTLTTKAGKNGMPVVIKEETDYPFFGKITFRFQLTQSTEFPFSVRIPAWAEGASLKVNKEKAIAVTAGTFYTVNRSFKNGDVIILQLPMTVSKETPVANAISITRGPLLFALNIKEDKKPVTNQTKTSEAFPAWDIEPASDWNYSLDGQPNNTKYIKVVTRPLKGFPWLPEASPVKLIMNGRQVINWKANTTMPALPAVGFTTGKSKFVELIPEGATRVRLSIFPVSGKLLE